MNYLGNSNGSSVDHFPIYCQRAYSLGLRFPVGLQDTSGSLDVFARRSVEFIYDRDLIRMWIREGAQDN